ncbi:hypothetical protein [Kineobactrum salinum]|uniref:Uncharacterized protein n=1 Tax=Kineobactrum salinum TaxID=2708301 RepID=A0A6C0U1F0_9GAMM|nr:hypothetical protein [Kineobactrum salinum]QIB65379.1 hypothetical protein G3T16_08165 [Kineobactrum salinum]
MQTALPNTSHNPAIARSRSAAGPGLAGALLVVLTVAACWWLMGEETQRHWEPPSHVYLSAGERHYRVPVARMSSLHDYSQAFIEHSAAQRSAALEPQLERQLDAMFRRVESRLPEFLDWYYSLAGEYSRIGMSAGSVLGVAEGNYVADRAATMLFAQAGWDEGIAQLREKLGSHLSHEEQASRASWLAGLMQQLAPYRVPAPLPSSAGDAPAAGPRLSLDSLQRSLQTSELLAFEERLALSTGGALAGVTVWRASRAGAAVAARGAGRGVGRAGSAAAGAALGCAPGGPWALACALAAGTVAWVAVDWALLRTEEALRRDALEASLRQSLGDFRQQLQLRVMAAVEADIRREHAQWQDTIDREFLPLQGIASRQ